MYIHTYTHIAPAEQHRGPGVVPVELDGEAGRRVAVAGGLNRTILYYTILYYTILYYTIICYTVITYCNILYHNILYYTVHVICVCYTYRHDM